MPLIVDFKDIKEDVKVVFDRLFSVAHLVFVFKAEERDE